MKDEKKLNFRDILVKEGFITEGQLAEALTCQRAKENYVPLGEILVASGYLSR
jgi:hypothetical protein